MSGIAVTDVRFVVASTRAQRSSPADLAGLFPVYMPSVEEGFVFHFIESAGERPERMFIGIHEAMARSEIARRTHTKESQSSAAGMRFVDALIEFGNRVAHV